jgi:Xaa-Pro aminopeptidase
MSKKAMSEVISPEMTAWRDIDWKKLTEINVKKLQKLMKKRQMDILIVQSLDNFQYITGYRVPANINLLYYLHRQGAILHVDSDQPIMLAGAADIFDVTHFHWIKDVRPTPINAGLWPKIIKKALKDHKIDGGTIGLDYTMQHVLAEKLKTELRENYKFVDGSEILETARAVKNEEEIKIHRRAVALAEVQMRAAIDSVREGVREVEVAAKAEFALRMADSEAFPAWSLFVMSGDRAAYLERVASNKIIRRGEIVMIDGGCHYNGYYAEFSRHVMVGEPTREQKELYRVAWEAEQKAVKAIGPGVKASKIDAIARGIIKDAGYEKYQHPHITGHGHGLELHEAPMIGDIGQVKEYILEPGMIVAIEPGIFKPGVGGVREEDIVLVTERGHEVLTRMGYEEKLLS